VVNREGATNIMLTEGSVTIKAEDGKEIKMQPGDFVELNKEQPEKKEVKKENVLAWQEHKVVFESTPMTEVVKTIEQLYGVKIDLADEVASNTISGILPNKITKTDNIIVITRP
jgi:transmembrane sensor